MIRAGRPGGNVLRLIRFAQTAEDLMSPDPATIPLDATAREAASLLTERGQATAPVVNDDGRPVGCVSRADIVRLAGRAVGQGRTAAEFFDVDDLVSWSASNRMTPIVPDVPGGIGVREIMDRSIHCVGRGVSAANVVERLLAKHVKRLLVVDENGRLVGTVSAVDVLRNLRR